jgi:hypothetical protein
MAVKFNQLAIQILQEDKEFGSKISVAQHQVLADYFKFQDRATTNRAKEILLQNQHLKGLVGLEAQKLLDNSVFFETFVPHVAQMFRK